MSRLMVISCDKCGKTKGITNHWYKVWVDQGIFHTCPFDTSLMITNPKTGDHLIPFDVCSQGCSISMYQSFLDHGQAFPPELAYALEIAPPTDDIPF
jgi:hypothetical protein